MNFSANLELPISLLLKVFLSWSIRKTMQVYFSFIVAMVIFHYKFYAITIIAGVLGIIYNFRKINTWLNIFSTRKQKSKPLQEIEYQA